MRPVAALLTLALAAAGMAAGGIDQPNAILINVSQDDLNRIVRGAFHEQGGPRIEGSRERVSSTVSDLHYRADFSEPVLHLGDAGRASLRLDLLEADVRVGRLERRFLGRMASCDNAGVQVEPDEPVDVTLDFRFAIVGGDLRILPERLRLGNTEGFRLTRPTKCRRTFLPRWLVWWLGKSRLRRQVERLDDVLLERARASAAELNERDLLHHEWSDVQVFPDHLDTSMGSLFVSLTGSTSEPSAERPAPPDWVASLAGGSFLGLSEPFLNAVIGSATARLDRDLHAPAGGLAKLFRSSSVYALIPGLREVESRDALRFRFALHEVPRLEIVGPDDGALPGAEGAMIRVRLSGIEIELWETDARRLGSIHIDSATLGMLPYLNPVGGISFETVENDWFVSSEGIEVDEATLAAVLQELVFGKAFETGQQPLARGVLDVGPTAFHPRYFSRVGRHLVVGLAGL